MTWDDLVERDGLYYKENSDVPFTGTLTSGLVQAALKKVKPDAPFVAYHENGQLEAKGNYKDGELDGP